METLTTALNAIVEDMAIDLYAMARLEEYLPHAGDDASMAATLTARAHHWDNADRTRRVIRRIIGHNTPAGDAMAAHFIGLAEEIAGIMHTLAPDNAAHDTHDLERLRDRAVSHLNR